MCVFFVFRLLRQRVVFKRSREGSPSRLQPQRRHSGRERSGGKGRFLEHRCLREGVAETWRLVVLQIRFSRSKESGPGCSVSVNHSYLVLLNNCHRCKGLYYTMRLHQSPDSSTFQGFKQSCFVNIMFLRNNNRLH